MKLLSRLIQLHKIFFVMTILITFFSVFMNLYWNYFLAGMIDHLGSVTSFSSTMEGISIVTLVLIVFILMATEYWSSFLASYTCEYFAHEMRMGYARYYLKSDIRMLSKLNVGEEQSAMQNELNEISSYLNENLFSLIKQFIAFLFTVIFLLFQSSKLALLSIVPVVPLIIYCSFSSKMIKGYTEQCQESKKQINGLSDILLELFPIIRVYNANKLIYTSMNERLDKWQNASIKKERTAARLMSISGLLSFGPLLMLLGIGGIMVIQGEITLGVFYIFINLSGNVSGFLQNMPNIYAGFRSFSAAVRRIENKIVLERHRD